MKFCSVRPKDAFILMVHSDLIAVHRSTSADASLSQHLCALRIFVCVTRVVTQKTSIDRRRPMQNDRKSERTIREGIG